MKKIVWDLDGVIRDLMHYMRNKLDAPNTRMWYWDVKGKDIYDLVKEDEYMALIYSPPTEYLFTVMKYIKKIEIWSNQPEEWRSFTKDWLDVYIGDYSIRYLNTEEKRKRLDKYKNIWLVEDNPNFKNYNRIILIDRLYNQKVKCRIRIKAIHELEHILKTWGENKLAKI